MQQAWRTRMQEEEHRIQLEGGLVFYRVAGNGPPVVFLHGLSGSGRWWSRNIATIAEHFRVFTVDLQGFGASRRAAFTLAGAAASISDLMGRLGLERASVVGHSMGGYIAADFAATHPEQVNRLVLVDAVAMPERRSLRHHAMGIAESALRLPPRFWPVLVTDAMRAGPWTILNVARDLISADLSDKLKHIEAPTLVIWGEHDTLVPLENGQHIVDSLPNGRMDIIPGAGHNPMWDKPKTFNRVLLDFLGVPSEAEAASSP